MAIKFHVLSDNEVHGVILNALYSAARTYDELAKVDAVQGMEGKTMLELAEQFTKQAKDARSMAERLEQAVSVNLAIEA